MKEIRTFDHFPQENDCPICHTREDGKTVLLAKIGTRKDGICEAVPVHLVCAVAKHFDETMQIIYRFPD